MPHDDWKATKSGNRLLSWHRTLNDGGWLTVQPQPDGTWTWQRRGPERNAADHGVLKAEGRAEFVDEALTAADESAQATREG